MTSFAPVIAAGVVSSVVVLISNNLQCAKKRQLFQTGFFAVLLAVGVSVVKSDSSAESSAMQLWATFGALPDKIRFVLTLVIISAVYFLGGLFVSSSSIESKKDKVSQKLAALFPASVDNETGFEIPDYMPENNKEFFIGFQDKLLKEFVDSLPQYYEQSAEVCQWITKMVDYNVKGGKMNRGLAVLDVQKRLLAAGGHPVTPKDRCQAAALGWAIEFLQAFFLVSDDIMDASITRRGNPCWYRLEHVKMIAINDAFILETILYKILKKYFGTESYYHQLVDLFLEVSRQTELGQLVDLTSQSLDGTIDLTRFTMERYVSIVRYKTAFYSFYLPVALGMITCGITDRAAFDKAREILVLMGEYFQVQDDFLDCYGKPEDIGKIGTDIQDNKCSWLVVTALNKATPAQRAVLENHYGKHDNQSIERIKELYREMNIADDFHAYEEKVYKSIREMMANTTEVPSEVFDFLLSKIYKRSK